MSKVVVLGILLVTACKHGPSSTQCEAARDQFLANHAQRIAKVLAEDDEKHRETDKKDAEVEAAAYQARFVAACTATKDFKLTCFTSVEREDPPDCKQFTKDLSHALLR